MPTAPEGSVRTSSLYYLSHVLWRVFRFALMACMTFVILYPLFYMASMAFRTVEDVFDPTIVWIPRHFTIQNFLGVIDLINYWQALGNTVAISLVSSLLQLIVCSLTGYSLARFAFRGKTVYLLLILATILIPPQMISMPIFINFKDFDIFGILHALTGRGTGITLLGGPLSEILLAAFGQGIRAGLFILIFYQLFAHIPLEIEEAAMIDGCGYAGTYWRIMLPNVRNGLITVFLFSVVWYWNDYYLSSIFMNNFHTVSTQLSSLRALFEMNIQQGGQLDPYRVVVMEQACCILTILPMLLLYAFTQRYFAQGLERSGIVG